VRGAAAGAAAAVAWSASEPVLRRLTGTTYSNARLLGRFATRGPAWPVAGLALHVANGAVFGVAFERLGLQGVKAGVVAAEVENTLAWPAMAIVDRIHPDRRDGTWPRLVRSPRVAAQEIVGHAIFGAVLGALAGAPRPAWTAARSGVLRREVEC
jgi:hypothetical protein